MVFEFWEFLEFVFHVWERVLKSECVWEQLSISRAFQMLCTFHLDFESGLHPYSYLSSLLFLIEW